MRMYIPMLIQVEFLFEELARPFWQPLKIPFLPCRPGVCSKLSGSRGEVFDWQRDLQLFDAWTIRALWSWCWNPRLMAKHIKQSMDSLALHALITWQLLHSCVGHEKDSHNIFSQTLENSSISSAMFQEKQQFSPMNFVEKPLGS